MDLKQWSSTMLVRYYLGLMKQEFDDFHLEYESGSSDGGFQSSTIFGRIIYKKSKNYGRTDPLAMKTTPSIEAPISYNDLSFLNESIFYREVSSLFEAVDPSIRRILPKYHASVFSFDEHAMQRAIIMENLQTSGYAQTKSKLFINYEQILTMVRTLGEFHSYSYKAKQTFGKRFEYLTEVLVETHYSVNKSLGTFLGPVCQYYLKMMENDITYGNKVKEIRQILSNGEEVLASIFTKYNPETAVITHGDYLRSNVLFANGVSPPLKIIDFANVRCASPALDLILVLYLNVDQETRHKHWDEFNDEYYTVLKGKFPECRVPTKEAILHEIRTTALHAFIIACSFVPAMVLMDRSSMKDVLFPVNDTDDVKVGWFVNLSKLSEPQSMNIIQDIIKDMIDRGFI